MIYLFGFPGIPLGISHGILRLIPPGISLEIFSGIPPRCQNLDFFLCQPSLVQITILICIIIHVHNRNTYAMKRFEIWELGKWIHVLRWKWILRTTTHLLDEHFYSSLSYWINLNITVLWRRRQNSISIMHMFCAFYNPNCFWMELDEYLSMSLLDITSGTINR